MKKRTFSLLLLFSLLLSLFPTAAFADEEDTQVETPFGTPTFETETSLGTLITRTLENQKEDDPFPGKITNLEIMGTLAWVELCVDRDAELVVAIYPDSETDVQMLASGIARLGAGLQRVQLSVEIAEMPAFFVAVAYLLDPDTHEPLSNSYISRRNTVSFQNFMQTTVADYDPARVVNLDDDDSNNFLVFGEHVLLFSETPGVNELIDNGNGSYTILRADARFRALKAGDCFAYSRADGTMLIMAAASVQAAGDTVTVVEDTEAVLEDVFAYVKINTSNVPGENTGETQNLSAPGGAALFGSHGAEDMPFVSGGDKALEPALLDGSTELYSEDWSFEDKTELESDFDLTGATKFEFNIGTSDNDPEILNAKVIVEIAANIQLYTCDHWCSDTMKLDYSVEFMVEAGGRVPKKQLWESNPPFTVPLQVTGLTLSVPLAVVFEAEAKVTVPVVKIAGTFGMHWDSDYGEENLTTRPSIQYFEISDGPVSGKVFIGFEMGAQVGCVVPKLCVTGVEAEIGVEINGKLRGKETTDSRRHTCTLCVEGDVSIISEVSIQFKALFNTIQHKWTALEASFKWGDFYYSIDNNEFGWNQTCPHISYKVPVLAVDKFGKPIQDAELLGKNLYTDSDGRASLYLPNGKHTLALKKGESYGEKRITVNNSEKGVIKIMLIEGAQPTYNIEPTPGPTYPIQGLCGKNVTWKLNSNGVLLIEGKGNMTNYAYYTSVPWFSRRDDIKIVIIRSGVESIGEKAFWSCSNLTRVTIPSSVTRIGDEAFSCCYSLTGVTIPSSVNYIGYKAFEWCHSLTKIRIPDSVTYLGSEAFSHCRGLTSVTISGSLKSIYSNMFFYCDNLESVTVPNGVTTIYEGAFSSCSNLTSVTLPDSLTYICHNAFDWCTSLTKIRIPNNVKTIGEEAFYYCTGLASVNIPSGITDIARKAFGACESLKNITIPASVREIGAEAFWECRSLTSVSIPASVTYIGPRAFSHCTRLTSVTLPRALKTIEEETFSYTNLTSITIPASVTSIGKKAFTNSGLTNITIPNGMTSIGEEAFFNCYCLESVSIPHSVTTIEVNAFYGCANLSSLTIPDSVTTIGSSAFADCYGLTSVIIPSSVTTIGSGIFWNCTPTDVYYSGTEEQWMDVGFWFDGATIHYNSTGPANGIANLSSKPLLAKLLASYSGENGEQDGLRLASFSGLKPGAEYVLLVTTDESADTLLAPENLLYIAQGMAGEDGRLTFSYSPRLDSVGGVKLFGPSPQDLADAKVTVEQFGDGGCQVTVTCGDYVLTEDEDYRLTLREDSLNLTATVTGLGAYSGSQTVEGQKLAVTVYLESNGVSARQAKLLGESLALPVLLRAGWVFRGWAVDSAAAKPDYLPGDSYAADADVRLYALWGTPAPDCVLPASLLSIGDEAFFDCGFTCIQIPYGLSAIGEKAFVGSDTLQYIYIPESVVKIADSAFDGFDSLFIYGTTWSEAEIYAAAKGFAFIAIE